jgi:hypothetical protein
MGHPALRWKLVFLVFANESFGLMDELDAVKKFFATLCLGSLFMQRLQLLRLAAQVADLYSACFRDEFTRAEFLLAV